MSINNIQIVRAGILPAWGQPRRLSQLIQFLFLSSTHDRTYRIKLTLLGDRNPLFTLLQVNWRGRY